MYRATRRLRTCACALLLACTTMAGCGDDGTPDVDLAEVIVVNTPDSFTATLVGFGYSGSVDRTWSCSGTQARLSLGTSLLGGSVHIRVYDDAGTSVYDNHHGATMGGLAVQTRPGGAAGTWRVVLDFTDACWTGAITLDADTPQTNDAIAIGDGIGGSDSYVFFADWDASAETPVHVSAASGLSSGSIQIRIWDPAVAPPAAPTTTHAITTGIGAISDDIVTATARGTWRIEIDLTGCTLGGAIDITNGP